MKTISKFKSIILQSLGVTLLILFIALSSCKKSDKTVIYTKFNYAANFVKSSSTVVTSATGTVTAVFDTTTMVLDYTVTWSGLTANAAAMHFHDAGPVIYPITGFATAMSGTLSGIVALTASQSADLAAGKIYVQIHTATYPAGEILAYLMKGSVYTAAATTNTGGSYMY